MTGLATADARIAVEVQRDLEVDPIVLRKLLPEEAVLLLHRFLQHAMVMARRSARCARAHRGVSSP